MTSRKPTPLKDEKTDPIEELQEQVAELIAAVNSLAEKSASTTEPQPGERFQNAVASAVVKAVQDLLEARQRKFEEADKGKMTVNEVLQEILGQYEDICGKAKGFYLIYKGADDRFKHIDENLQKLCGNEKLLYEMMKSVLQVHNIKSGVERPPIPSGSYKRTLRYLIWDMPLYGLKCCWKSTSLRKFAVICLILALAVSIGLNLIMANDNAQLRKEVISYKYILRGGGK